jgi:hypothetical protein
MSNILSQDWKTHKPYCRPNAPCSVIEDGDGTLGVGGPSKYGALSIPVTGLDGETGLLSSSTMSAKMLKEIKEHTESRGGSSSSARRDVISTFPRNFHVEVERLI